MSITIKKNNKPELPLCVMSCDGMLHEKLEKYEMLNHLNRHSTNLFVGKPKSGKSSLIWSLFKSPKIFRKVFHTIFYFSPDNSRGSMKDNIFDKLPEDQKFSELTYDNLKYVIDRIKAGEKDEKFCIIYDDMGAYLKNIETLQLFKELCMNKRHLHISQFFLVQTWYSVVKDVRRLFDNIFVFKVSKNELENIFEEVVEVHKNKVLEISKVVYDKPFEYLVINTESNRLYKGFDEILFNE
jgi:hypothetical protein